MRRIASWIAVFAFVGAVTLARAEDPKDGWFRTSDGIMIHYLTLGEKGSWVVLIHGFTGNAMDNWFNNGIAQELAKNHRVVAIDNRNHGKSDKPQKDGSGRADDTLELMNHLKIEKAHIGGYSMGGAFTRALLTTHPEKFITAHFGGSGIGATGEQGQKDAALDKSGTDPENAEASRKLSIMHQMDNGLTQAEAEKAVAERAQNRGAGTAAGARGQATRTAAGGEGSGTDTARPAAGAVATANATRPATAGAGDGATTGAAAGAAAGARGRGARGATAEIDLTKITIPVIAINGEFDRPHAKTERMQRELKNFKNVILPGKQHLTAIAPGTMPKEYLENLVTFINANDPK